MRRCVVTTGGAGYIGSHVTVVLLAAGYDVVIVDNFENAARDVPDRIGYIASTAPRVVEADCRNESAMEAVFSAEPVHAVVHLAGRKSAPESVVDPLAYYGTNLSSSVTLFAAALRHGVRNIVFSSSAAVYGMVEMVPTPEGVVPNPANPYGRTKRIVELMLDDLAVSQPDLGAVSLRYFNPVGCHVSHLIGDPINGKAPNLFTHVARATAGLAETVAIFGNDYDTSDGTGVRDYIHVVDLAEGHLAALKALESNRYRGRHAIMNLGSGRGYSVLEVLDGFAEASGMPVPRSIVARRPGDVARSVADPARAARELDWRAAQGLPRMCADHWAFFRNALAAAPKL